MANKRISALDNLGATPAVGDILPITDIDDPTGSPQGTTKGVTFSDLTNHLATAVSLGNHESLTSAVHGISAFGATLVDDADAATARLTLGLGTAATSASTDFSPAFFSTVSETTTARTLSNTDNGKIIVCSNASDVTITLPNGLTSGFNCTLVQESSGIVKVITSGSAALYGYNSNNATAGRYASVNIYPIGTDSYVLDGTAQAIAPPGANALHYPNGIFFNPLATYYISTQPIMHFDADYIDGADDANNPTNGATLTSWGDRSGGATNYDLSQATAAEQPTYYSVAGLTGVTCDSGDYFDLATSLATPTSLTQVIIATNTDGAENSLIGLSPDSTSATSANTLFGTGGAYQTQIKLAGTSQTTNQPTFSQTDPNIHVVTKAGAAWKYWHQGGSSVYSITASYSKTLTTMFAGYFQGVDARIHEVLVFDSALSTSDLNIIKGYANTKYSGLSASDFS
jgi:hypothetical protein